MRKQATRPFYLKTSPARYSYLFLSFPILLLSAFLSLSTPGTNSNKRTSSAHGWSYAAWKMENTPRKHDPPRPSETRCRVDFVDEGWWPSVGWDNETVCLRAFQVAQYPSRQGWIIVWQFTDECRSSYNCNEP